MTTINDILQAVLNLNETQGIDAFFDYSGHVNKLEVRVNYMADYDEEDHNEIYDYYFYLDRDHAEELEKMASELMSIKYEAEQKLSQLTGIQE
jgi:hypothetical protein